MGRCGSIALALESVEITLVGGVCSSSDGRDGVQYRLGPGLSTGAQCLCLESQSGDGATKLSGLRLYPDRVSAEIGDDLQLQIEGGGRQQVLHGAC